MASDSFDQRETKRQALLKSCWWPGLEDGMWRGRRYSHILPESHSIENLHGGIRDGVRAYTDTNGIELHSDFANLKSSQACCLNFLFALCRNLDAATTALRPLLPGATSVDWIEFEYTGPHGDHATKWLGEPPGGKRGQNRTSADAAIWWRDGDDRRRLTLVEWKYTERQFGTCGGFASDGNRHKDRCRHRADGASAEWRCYLTQGDSERTKRRYWDRLGDAGITLTPYEGDMCPFSGPFYQLMRLQLLAAYCAQRDGETRADVVAVHFRGDTAIEQPPGELKCLGSTVTEAWQRMLQRPDDFRVCLAEDLAAAIRGSEAYCSLAEYLGKRYGV